MFLCKVENFVRLTDRPTDRPKRRNERTNEGGGKSINEQDGIDEDDDNDDNNTIVQSRECGEKWPPWMQLCCCSSFACRHVVVRDSEIELSLSWILAKIMSAMTVMSLLVLFGSVSRFVTIPSIHSQWSLKPNYESLRRPNDRQCGFSSFSSPSSSSSSSSR